MGTTHKIQLGSFHLGSWLNILHMKSSAGERSKCGEMSPTTVLKMRASSQAMVARVYYPRTQEAEAGVSRV